MVFIFFEDNKWDLFILFFFFLGVWVSSGVLGESKPRRGGPTAKFLFFHSSNSLLPSFPQPHHHHHHSHKMLLAAEEASWDSWWVVAIPLILVGLWVWRNRNAAATAKKNKLLVSQKVEGSEAWKGKKVCLVVNPTAGEGRAWHIMQNVTKPILQNAGVIVDVLGTPSPSNERRGLYASPSFSFFFFYSSACAWSSSFSHYVHIPFPVIH